MGLQIEDGTGSGAKAKVTTENEVLTNARTIPRATHISEDNGQTYAWTSTDATSAAEESISVQNTSSDLNLHIERIIFAGVQATVHAVLLVSRERFGRIEEESRRTGIVGKRLQDWQMKTETLAAGGRRCHDYMFTSARSRNGLHLMIEELLNAFLFERLDQTGVHIRHAAVARLGRRN